MPSDTRSRSGFQHELISASAGSGKTYQLVRRYLHLLALGEEPQRIVAMTFTRKAAGEFFNRILSQLAKLAVKPELAAHYFKDLQPVVPKGVDYAALLRLLTRQTPRLRLGTLDSFFTAIAACFPMETGLPATAMVMDEDEAEQAQMETLDALLDGMQTGGARDRQTQLLLDAIKTASFSLEPKSVEDLLRDWVKSNHRLWLESADADAWGNLARLWSEEIDSQEPDSKALQRWAARLRDLFPETTSSGADLLDALHDEVLVTTPGTPPPKAVTAFLKKSGEHCDDLLRGQATITWGRRKTEISGETAQAWLALAHGLCRREFLVRAQRARGLASFLAAFEALYHQRVRAQGQLSFADIPLLLGAAARADAAWPGEDIWFRLDSRFDHWMLDEFQDTSHSQWRVTERLVSEVLQDADGRRSFFAVGDVKQSIYLWRYAEPELFARLMERPDVHVSTLTESYRSAPEVLEAVNQVFSDVNAIEALLPGATENWLFEPHRSAKPDLKGYAALLQMTQDVASEAGAENGSDDESDDLAFSLSARAASALLRRLDPLARGQTCAVITRSNKVAKRLATELRALTHMSVVTESKSQPTQDNAPVLALLSLLQLAAHPDDSAAREHLRMTPMRALLENENHGLAATALRVAEAVFERGFTAFALEWTERLRELLPDMDAFHQHRLAEFADLCATFDESGSRDLDQFLQTAREHELSHPTGSDAVQVMTVHKSKGLEFDVVIATEMGRDAMNLERKSPWLAQQEEGQTTWVLQTPLKNYREADPVLRAHQRQAQAAAGFESLCVLYVTMTRAKHALYLLTPPPPKAGKSMKPDTFLRQRLGAETVNELALDGQRLEVLWQCGDPAWFETLPAPAPAAPAAEPTPVVLRDLLRENQPRQRRRTPSGEEDFRVPGRVLFAPGRDLGRRLGSRVHEMLAEIEWWTAGDPVDSLKTRWLERGLIEEDDTLSQQALHLVLPVLNDPALAPAFAKPAAAARAWREKPFDFIDDGGWISGVFDRVVLELDSQGIATSARLIDFKTDDTPDAEALEEKSRGYAPQLALYRRAVSRLTGLPPERVTCHLLFLRGRQFAEF